MMGMEPDESPDRDRGPGLTLEGGARGVRAGGDAELQASTDGELMAGIRAGDEVAMRVLVERHGDRLFSLARTIMGRGADAEEVCADAFVQAWRTADRFDPTRGSVSGWLTMITRSRALDRVRTRTKRSQAAERVRVEMETAGVTEVEDAARRAEVSEAGRLVRSALDELPPEQRRVIELSYFGGLSQREIAESLSLPLGTVKTRMLAAMKRLRDQLAPLVREEVA